MLGGGLGSAVQCYFCLKNFALSRVSLLLSREEL